MKTIDRALSGPFAFLTCLIGVAGTLNAQPTISTVVDGAALSVNIAQGSVFIVKGTGLSGPGTVQATAPSYPTTLNNVKIALTSATGGSAIPVLMVYTYNDGTVNQLAAVLPSAVAAGAYDLRVTNGTNSSAAFRTNVVLRKPGIVTSTGDGLGIAQATLQGGLILQRTSAQGKIGNYDTRPAHPGDRMDLWGTGLGPDAASDIGGTSGDQTAVATIRVLFDGVEIVPAYAGRSQGYPGLDQIVFTIPANITLSCTNSIQVRESNGSGGTVLSNAVTVATSAASATVCPAPSGGGTGGGGSGSGGSGSGGLWLSPSEIDGIVAAGLFRAGNAGLVKSTNYTVYDIGSNGTTTEVSKSEEYTPNFFTAIGSGLRNLLEEVWSGKLIPPAGQCSVVHAPTFPALTITSSSGGPQTVTGPVGSRTSSQILPTNLPSGFIVPGTYQFSGAGDNSGPVAENIGAYSTTLTTPGSEVIWTNRASLLTVNRSQPLTLTWSGGSPGTQVAIGGADDTVGFNCSADAALGSFTIPSNILSQISASSVTTTGAFPVVNRGSLTVSSGVGSNRINVSGLNIFYVAINWQISQSVQWK
ncbi:MAG: hypothetical protein ABI824_10000 [Acidobacteriota bacterium]